MGSLAEKPRSPDDVQRPLTAREYELELKLTQAEAEAEKAKIAAVGEALKSLVEQPGPKAALEGLGAMLHAQAQLSVNVEQHQHEQAMLGVKNAHEQQLQDKRDADAHREREARARSRQEWLSVSFILSLVILAVVLGLLVHAGKIDKSSAGVAGAFFAIVLHNILTQAKRK